MRIDDTRYAIDTEGYPCVTLLYNGKKATVSIFQKNTNLDLGYVRLDPGSYWTDELEPIHLAPEEGRDEIILKSSIFSPELVALLRRMERDKELGIFTPGPVRFP